jgi:hypothetical protein
MLPGSEERSETPQKSGHKVPIHETVPSVDHLVYIRASSFRV